MSQLRHDINEIRRTLGIILMPGQVTELRAVVAVDPDWPKRTVPIISGYFDTDHLEDLAQAAAKIRAKGIYIVPNRVEPELLYRAINRARVLGPTDPTTSDNRIIRRLWLLIDADPRRPDSHISATDEEHEAALAMAQKIRAWLTDQGWPLPIYADSGNGGHLMYAVDLPPDDAGLIQRCLQALGGMFDDEAVKVDQTVFNQARIWKLYGTVACKGDDDPKRPHRLSRILEAPETREVVPVELLEALAGPATEPGKKSVAEQPRSNGHNNNGTFDVPAWLAAHGLTVKDEKPYQGGTRWRLDVCPYDPSHTDNSAVVIQGADGKIGASCSHDSCKWNWTALRAKLDPAYAAKKAGLVVVKGDSDAVPPSEMEVNLLTYETSDEGNAEAVYALHGQRFRFVREWGWLHYTGTHWSTEGAEAALGFAVVETLRERRDRAISAELEGLAKFCKTNKGRVQACIVMLEKHVIATTEEFDTEPLLLNAANGVVNLKTGELAPHSPEQRFTYCIPTPYDNEADYDEWLAFLHSITPSAEVALYLQEVVGYALTGETREECLWYIYGPSRSGKGTFCSALLRMMGHTLAVQIDFNTFVGQKGNPDAQNFALAPLKPARLVFASESGQYDMLANAKVKTVTGGDDVRCCFKGKDHFSYRPQFKIFLSSNERPKANPDDKAFWERAVKVVEFPHSFLGEEDKSLKYRLQSKENLKGVLRWAIEGAMRWAARPQEKGLQHPAEVVEATRRSRNELDTVQQWLDECCQSQEGSFAPNVKLRVSYENWCESHGHKPKGGSGLGRALAAKGFETDKKTPPGGTQVRGVLGLIITPEAQNDVAF
jgi:P4 family phage/plasmid primase-like protien